MGHQTDGGGQLEGFLLDSRQRYEGLLESLVNIPTVSSNRQKHYDDCLRGAAAARDFLRSIGAQAELIETNPAPHPQFAGQKAGLPVVFGRFETSPDHPTVTIYNHLDVQPADRRDGWDSEPFVMEVRGDRYVGRGTTDDKGPALSAALAAEHAQRLGVPLNINFLWEMEEEIGSTNFERFLRGDPERYKTDSVVVSDTVWVSKKRPAISYGLRGLAGMVVTLQCGAKDVHSGLAGGPARNPVGELCAVISQCYDAATGRVKIDGFYDDVEDPPREEIENFLASGFTTEGFKAEHELKLLRYEEVERVVRAVMVEPTFEVHGIAGGYTEPDGSVKSIVPHRAEAKISCRLAPNQDPEKIYELVAGFISKLNPDVRVQKKALIRPFKGEIGDAYHRAAREALAAAFGAEPAFVRQGGSIGAIITMKEILRAPVVMLGLSLPEHGYHAKNEYFEWEQASGGIKMFLHYFESISKLKG